MRRNARAFRPEALLLETKVLLSLAADPVAEKGDPGEVAILAATSTPASEPGNPDGSVASPTAPPGDPGDLADLAATSRPPTGDPGDLVYPVSTGDSGELAYLATTTSAPAGARSRQPNTITGSYFAGQDNRAADAPLDVKLNGTGNVRGMGRSRMSGSLQMGGFRIDAQDISGTVTLSNARGTLTVRLSGSGGYGEVPGSAFDLRASVVRGTGAFKKLQGTGTASVQFGPSTVMVKATEPTGAIGGSLAVRLNLNLSTR